MNAAGHHLPSRRPSFPRYHGTLPLSTLFFPKIGNNSSIHGASSSALVHGVPTQAPPATLLPAPPPRAPLLSPSCTQRRHHLHLLPCLSPVQQGGHGHRPPRPFSPCSVLRPQAAAGRVPSPCSTAPKQQQQQQPCFLFPALASSIHGARQVFGEMPQRGQHADNIQKPFGAMPQSTSLQQALPLPAPLCCLMLKAWQQAGCRPQPVRGYAPNRGATTMSTQLRLHWPLGVRDNVSKDDSCHVVGLDGDDPGPSHEPEDDVGQHDVTSAQPQLVPASSLYLPQALGRCCGVNNRNPKPCRVPEDGVNRHGVASPRHQLVPASHIFLP